MNFKSKVVLTIFFIFNILYGGVPSGINYQGRYEENGQPVTGQRSFRFNLYNAATGGTLLWTSGDVSINVVDGLFNYVLNCRDIDWRNNDVYLEVVVGGTTLSPRERIQSSAYAFYSSSASYAENSMKLNSQPASYYLNTSATPQVKYGELSCVIGNTTFYMVPRGAIIMWSGSVASIPPGWQLCDGTNGTPDLRDKFIIGAGGTYSPGSTGGATSHTHSVDIPAFNSASAGAHTHSIDPPATNTSSAGNHSHIAHWAADDTTVYWNRVALSYTSNYSKPVSGTRTTQTYSMGYGISTSNDGAHTHSVDIPAFDSASAGAHTHSIDPPATTTTSSSHLPPYYALCYIMKL